MNELFILFIDAGHGGKDPGALGKNGVTEAAVVLAIALKAREILKKNHPRVKVILSRETDVFHELSARARMSNDAKANLFLSIHCNSAENPLAEGFELFTSPGQTKADAPATRLFERYAAKFPQIRRRMDVSDGDPDKEAKFTVLTKTAAPAILLETEFIQSERGSVFLSSAFNQERIAEVISDWAADEAKRAGF